MSDERDHNISREPDHSCPLIDDVIDGMSAARKALEDAEHDIEKVRRRVEEVRAWGEEWKQRAIELASELEQINRRNEVAA